MDKKRRGLEFSSESSTPNSTLHYTHSCIVLKIIPAKPSSMDRSSTKLQPVSSLQAQCIPPTHKLFAKPDISAPIPTPSILGQLSTFLPKMAAANRELASREQEDFSIEAVTTDERVIEMNISIGVLGEDSDEEEQQEEQRDIKIWLDGEHGASSDGNEGSGSDSSKDT